MTENVKKDSLVRVNGTSYLIPFALVTSLFLLWGCAHGLIDVLNKHFQDFLGVSKAKSGFLQFALYGGYFFMAIPAGLIMKKYGYRKGIIFGLLLFAVGAYMFIPAAHIQTFWFTLVCLFVIACGLTCLETAANPYTTVLGPKERASQRINFSQSFNGMGWIIGPTIGTYFILSHPAGSSVNQFAVISVPYIIVGSVVLFVAFLFMRTKLPEINEGDLLEGTGKAVKSSMWQYSHFKFAVVAQFLYVAAQTGINSFFINYVVDIFKLNNFLEFMQSSSFGQNIMNFVISFGALKENVEIETLYNTMAGLILAFGGFGLFWIGRLTGSLLLNWFKPNRLIAIYGIINVITMTVVVMQLGYVSLIALFVTYFCMSIMFPTIFALGIKDLGEHTKKASSYLVMGVAGGAICPPIMGYIADVSYMAIGFIIPLVCFAFIAFFGWRGYRVKS